MDEDLKRAVEFHGHMCPGLAIGYRVAKYVKDHYPRSGDEELVAIVENNSCSVDAIQDVLGCTFGKGNLIFKDHGKHVYTVYSRDQDRALRIYFKYDLSGPMTTLRQKYFSGTATPAEREEFERSRDQNIKDILNLEEKELLDVREIKIPPPQKARIYPSLCCQECGEAFMEVRGHTAAGKIVCQDCFERLVG
ncbi:MAG: formylmethanofuran dehydrogenase [Methanosarcinales archaeon]|nr:formylmethanofuran dehydrogenase [Methanosarcinales archaeon]